MQVSVGVSARHIHLTKDDFVILFGYDNLTKLKDITQVGQFASRECVTIQGPKGCFDNVRILGPFREYTQVEISKTDSYTLGLNPPIKDSGDLLGASEITIIGPKGSIKRNALIIATRHIHITTSQASKLNIKNKDKVAVKIDSEKPGIVIAEFKVSDSAYFELHLDLDDANAFMLKQGDIVDIKI